MPFISPMNVNIALTAYQKQRVFDFLKVNGFSFSSADLAVYIEDNSNIVACALVNDNIIQGICVASGYQGDNLSASIVSEIINICSSKNINELFIYTSPINADKFNRLGFNLITKTNHVALLERSQIGIIKSIKGLKSKIPSADNVGAIVVNANPFTLGHQFLIETAAAKCCQLIVFVVEEDLSFFKFKQRFKMVCEGTKHIGNVIVLPSTQYIISLKSFPTYFLKEQISQFDRIYAELDVQIFKQYFVPAFNINCRYVGSEPDCKLTGIYNDVLKSLIDRVEIIDRLQVNGQAVSASKVREIYQSIKLLINKMNEITDANLLKNFIKEIEDAKEKLYKLVPLSTFDYLFK